MCLIYKMTFLLFWPLSCMFFIVSSGTMMPTNVIERLQLTLGYFIALDVKQMHVVDAALCIS